MLSNTHRLMGTVALAAASILAPAAALSQASDPTAAEQSASEQPDDAAQADPAQVSAAARSLLAERYVLPDTAAKLAAALAAAEQRGEFEGLSGEALAEQINAVMRTVTTDGHLSMRHDPDMAAMLERRGPLRDDGELPPEMTREMERMNGGVAKLEVLPGNVRYLDYRGFMWGTPAVEQSLATAMEFLRGGDAIIIDLRGNGGGSPEAVAALTSYFVPAGTDLARFEMRGSPGQASETPEAPFSLADKPLYVLTSRRSASAAEEFATHVSAFDFGTLVGTTTAGAGFRNEFFPLPGGHVMSVSIGRPVHAVTGGDWEAVGVPPALEVAEDKALVRAQAEAVTAIAANAPERERTTLERLAAFYRAQESPADPGLALADYAGRYGPRTIAFADGALTTQRDGGPVTRLVPLGHHLFAPEAVPMQHFRFVVEGAEVAALEVDNGQGPAQRAPRG